jgi:hypothetical protein
MEQNMKTDDSYYAAAQAALLNYDSKLWQIPALFFALIGLLVKDVEFCLNLENGVIFIFISVALLILILLHNKAHIFHVSISKKINEIDNKYNDQVKRIPLTSMDNQELEIRMNELERKFLDKEVNEGAQFNCLQKFLARERISTWIRNSMIISFIIFFLLTFACFTVSVSNIFI